MTWTLASRRCLAAAVRAPTLARALAPILALAGVLGPGLAGGQMVESDIGIRADVDVGFSNVFRLGHWTPIGVNLHNRGRDRQVVLDIHTEAGDELQGTDFHVVHRRTLDLPRGARKRVEVNVLLPSFARPLRVELRDRRRELLTLEIDLRDRFTERPLLLVLSRDANLDYLSQGRSGPVRVLYPHLERLPGAWRAYDGVHAVLAHGTSLERLSGPQFQALRRWVAAGGRFVFSGGPDYSLSRTPRLASLLGARAVGLIQIAAPAAPALGLALGAAESAPLAATRAFDLNAIRLAPATADRSPFGQAADAGRPTVIRRWLDHALLVERRLGRGRALFLAVDVARAPFADWVGMAPLWADILELNTTGSGPAGFVSAAPPATQVPVDDTIVPYLYERGSVFPAHLVVLAFTVLYLGVLATGYRLPVSLGSSVPRTGRTGGARRARSASRALPRPVAMSVRAKRLAAVLMTWGAPLLFVPLAWYVFGPRLFPAGPALISIATIEPVGGSDQARMEFDLGLYSTTTGPMAVGFRGIDPALKATVSKDQIVQTGPSGATSSWVFQGGHRALARLPEQPAFRLHTLRGEDLIDFGWRALLDVSGPRPRLELHNRSAVTLPSAWLVYDENLYRLGRVASGARFAGDLPDAQGVSGTEALQMITADHARVPRLRAVRGALERTLMARNFAMPGRLPGSNLSAPNAPYSSAYVIALLDVVPGLGRDLELARREETTLVLAPVSVLGVPPDSAQDRDAHD